MTEIDLDELVAVLDPDRRGGRRGVDDLANAVHGLSDHVEASTVAELVLDTIRRGESEGRWSVARAVVLRGTTTLPRFVHLTRVPVPGDTLRPVEVPLRPELTTWASTLPLSAAQREVLLAANAWLRKTKGGQVPVVPAAERAYELLRDEKAFDSAPPRGGATLWRTGRLSFELLRCERVPTPLTWEPVTPTIGDSGPIVCVENHATFRTLLRVLREQPRPEWAAVAWIQGRNTTPLESLTSLPFPVLRLDYLGDLDAAGLAIAASACARAESIGIPAGPCTWLWELLAARPARSGRAISQDLAGQLVGWLPTTVQEAARVLLTSGQVVPQEALRYDVLAEAFRHRSP
jgi:hypothetical protein